MPFDLLALSAVRDELRPRLEGGRVQKLVFPDELSLALEVYRAGVGRTAVLLSAHPELGRVQRVERVPGRGVERDSPFALAARKHLRDARITCLRQPPLERVLELECEQRGDESDQHYSLSLIVEVMGRRGNLLLVSSDGIILDALRRAPPGRNPRRPILPHLKYEPPPAQRRLSPLGLDAAALADGARGRGGTLAAYLLETVAGLSPPASRELAYRAAGAAAAPLHPVDWPRVADAIGELFAPLRTHAWQPTLAVEGPQPGPLPLGEGRAEGTPVDYAPYPLTHLEAAGYRLQRFESMSAVLTAFYERAARARGRDPLTAEKRALAAPIERALAHARRRRRGLETQLATGREQQAPLRRAGEAILAHQWQLPAGATAFDVDGERIELDPTLSPVENAQRYFARYRKARDAAARVPPLLEAAEQAERHLEDLGALVEVADSMDAIRALRREVQAAVGTRAPGPAAGGQARAGRSGPPAGSRAARREPARAGPAAGPYRRVPLGDGWEALVGSSARGNATVTFDLARPDDLWLHARGVPGAHVVLRPPSGSSAQPPAAVLRGAAGLAARHSSARAAGQVDVDYVERRHVRRVPNGPPGLVRYTGERTLRVPPLESTAS
jgi:predicted ribosome quality control (RQC) complex YloA/Tae2 family protein